REFHVTGVQTCALPICEQALASRKDGINNRPAAARAAIPDKARSEKQGGPIPENGWDAYRKYLKDAVKPAHGQKGTVDLSFSVEIGRASCRERKKDTVG